MSDNIYDDVKNLRATVKALVRRIETLEYVAEAAHERADGLTDALRIVCDRVARASTGDNPFNQTLVGPGGLLRPLCSYETTDTAPVGWRIYFEAADEETKQLILIKINALHQLRNNRAQIAANKLKRELAKRPQTGGPEPK